MKRIALLSFAWLSITTAFAQRLPDKNWFMYENPEEAGFSVEKLDRAKQYYDSVGFGSALIIHKGAIVASWGENTRRFMMASMRKSLLSALIGNAIEEGKLDINATLADLKIDDLTPLTEKEKSAKVLDLLTTQSGIYLPSAFEFKGWRDRKPARGSHNPGTFWYYNNWDFNALCTIYEQATHKKIFSAFENEIARPIGMEDYRPMDGVYYHKPESKHPAYLFKMSSRDLARFGLLYLNEGKWNGKKIIPDSWVSLSTHTHATAYNDQYGYLWWTTPVNDKAAFTAQGAGSHILTVVPECGLVIVVRSNDYIVPINNGSEKKLVEMIVKAREKDISTDPRLLPYTWPEKELPNGVNLIPTNDSIIGTYSNPRLGEFTVEKEKAKFIVLAKPAKFNMICIDKDEFYIEDMNVKAVFKAATEPKQKHTCQFISQLESKERVFVFFY